MQRILRATALLTVLLVNVSGLAGLGRSTGQHGTGPGPDSTWLSWNSQTKTAGFKLIAGIPGNAKSPFNFNGYTDGELTLAVPVGATVVIQFVNNDGTPHSAEVIDGTQPIPNMGGDPAIPRAYTKAVTEGIAQGGTDVMRFIAQPAGDYRIACGVPGHGLSGMWIRFKVSVDAEVPTVSVTSGP
jgi:sulfocyanin